MEVGFVGLGKMGEPMARRLLAAGHAVHLYNRSRQVLERLAGEGGRPAASAGEVAARSRIVLSALPDPDTVEAVYREFSEHARAGQVYVDHSSVSPELSRSCRDLLAGRGADFLDAPVSGGPGGAEAGTLTVMAGGDQPAFQDVLPLFECYGANIKLCGPTGAGQAVKLVNQLLVAIHTAASAEAIAFGERLGADPEVLLEVIGTSFGASQMLVRNVPRFIAEDYFPATPVSVILKDLKLIHTAAREAEAPLMLGSLAEQLYVEASSRGLATQDMASLIITARRSRAGT